MDEEQRGFQSVADIECCPGIVFTLYSDVSGYHAPATTILVHRVGFHAQLSSGTLG